MTPLQLPVGRVRPDAAPAPAFQCWRRTPVGIGKAERVEIASALAPVALLGEPRFSNGALKDPAVAISLAYEHVWRGELVGPRRDLILAALWLWAASGDLASMLALLKIRQRLRAKP